MLVTIVGTGEMGSALVKALAPHHHVKWLGRNFDATRSKICTLNLSPSVQPAEIEDAFDADVIILALWHRDMLPFVRKHRTSLAGKVVVDISNPFTDDFEDFFTPFDTSAAEVLQAAIPEASVAGAFKNTFVAVFDDPIFTEGQADVLVTSDLSGIRQRVIELLSPLPFRILDAGLLKNNRTIERMTLLSREVGRRHGFSSRLSYRMLGQRS